MELERAQVIAAKYVEILRPLCERIQVAGSIRRKKPEVGDIEIVCIPKGKEMYQFMGTVNKWYKVKGEPTGKYTQRMLPEGIKLDLFMANRDNWGLILAIRTGSAEFSHRFLAVGWKKRGYTSTDGILVGQDGSRRYIREEEDLFDLIGVNFIDPSRREMK